MLTIDPSIEAAPVADKAAMLLNLKAEGFNDYEIFSAIEAAIGPQSWDDYNALRALAAEIEYNSKVNPRLARIAELEAERVGVQSNIDAIYSKYLQITAKTRVMQLDELKPFIDRMNAINEEITNLKRANDIDAEAFAINSQALPPPPEPLTDVQIRINELEGIIAQRAYTWPEFERMAAARIEAMGPADIQAQFLIADAAKYKNEIKTYQAEIDALRAQSTATPAELEIINAQLRALQDKDAMLKSNPFAYYSANLEEAASIIQGSQTLEDGILDLWNRIQWANRDAIPSDIGFAGLVTSATGSDFSMIDLYDLLVDRGLRDGDVIRQLQVDLNKEGITAEQYFADNPSEFEKVISEGTQGEANAAEQMTVNLVSVVETFNIQPDAAATITNAALGTEFTAADYERVKVEVQQPDYLTAVPVKEGPVTEGPGFVMREPILEKAQPANAGLLIAAGIAALTLLG